MSGPATTEQLHELHRRLTEALLSALDPDLKRRPGQDTLAVVGAFLRQEGVQGFLINPRRVRRLERLYSLYVEALLGHLEGGNASAGVLAEIGKTLRDAEVTKDGSALAVRPAEALRELASMALPFKH